MIASQQLPQVLIAMILACPLAVCILSGLCLFSPLWHQAWASRALGGLALSASLIAFVLSGALVLIPPAQALTPVVPLPFIGGIDLLIDALSIYFILLINAIAFFSSWNTISFLRGQADTTRWRSPASFHLFAQLFHLTMVLVPLMNNLIALWVAMQATTLVSTLLIGFQGHKNAREAAWKYLLIASTGIIFALLGTMFLANAAQNLIVPTAPPAEQNQIMSWTFLIQHALALRTNQNLVKLSFLFVLVGYGVKAGFAPMHTWLPDGHGEAPAPISAMLSGVLLKSALYAILRFYTITNAVLGSPAFTSEFLLGSAMLSLLISTPFILKRNRFKRVLAYHSLEHMGIITFGVGIGGRIALFGALLHVLNHAVTKALMFLAFGQIAQQYEQSARARDEPIAQPVGVLRSMPITGALLTLGGLALVGTPPFSIFMSELIMLWSALTRFVAAPAPTPTAPAILWWLSISAIAVFLISTTLIFGGLTRHLAGLLFGPAPQEQRMQERFADLLPLILLLCIVVASGVWILPPLTRLLSLSVEIVWPAGL
jgi:hydrogenase-4 component F